MSKARLSGEQIDALADLARRAGEEIVRIYRSDDWQVERKGDNSPITAADLAAHNIIVAGLQQLFPDWPVLSEESAEVCDATRRSWPRYWLVDPLDGTKEFLAKSGEFTVNIALIDEGESVFGTVYWPLGDELYQGGQSVGSWRVLGSERRLLHTRPAPSGNQQNPLIITASSRHSEAAAARISTALAERFDAIVARPLGSSLKLCRIAAGEVDCYPRYGRTGEWDTAAGHAVLRGAGGDILNRAGERLQYSKVTPYNSHFVAVGDPSLAWWSWLPEPRQRATSNN